MLQLYNFIATHAAFWFLVFMLMMIGRFCCQKGHTDMKIRVEKPEVLHFERISQRGHPAMGPMLFSVVWGRTEATTIGLVFVVLRSMVRGI
jgi:hypothetical protein